ARIRVEQVARRKAEVTHRARTQVLDDHIGAAGEPPEDVLRARLLQVESDAALRTVEAHEVTAFVVDARLEPAREVAAARVPDLHHVRTEIGQLHPAEGTGHVVADLEYAHAGEWWFRHGASL